MLSRKIGVINTLKNCCKQSSFFIISQRNQSEKAAVNPIPNQVIEKTINHVTLLGRVGSEPQKRGSEQHPVVLFSLATHTNFKNDSGELNQKSDWHRVCVFKPALRDLIYNYLRRGQRIYVSGKLSYGEVNDEKGNPKSVTTIIADDIIFFQ